VLVFRRCTYYAISIFSALMHLIGRQRALHLGLSTIINCGAAEHFVRTTRQAENAFVTNVKDATCETATLAQS